MYPMDILNILKDDDELKTRPEFDIDLIINALEQDPLIKALNQFNLKYSTKNFDFIQWLDNRFDIQIVHQKTQDQDGHATSTTNFYTVIQHGRSLSVKAFQTQFKKQIEWLTDHPAALRSDIFNSQYLPILNDDHTNNPVIYWWKFNQRRRYYHAIKMHLIKPKQHTTTYPTYQAINPIQSALKFLAHNISMTWPTNHNDN